jgi:hypothetical protein
VYGHLLRDGYIVRRHPVRWTLGDAETAASVWRWGTAATAAAAASSACAPPGAATVTTDAAAATPLSAPPAADSGPPPPMAPAPAPPRKRRRLEPSGCDSPAASAPPHWWPALGSAAAAATWMGCVDAAFVAALPAGEVDAEGEGLSLAERFPPLAPLRELRPADAPLGRAAAGGLGRPPGAVLADAAVGGALAAPCFDVFQPNGRFSRNRPDPVALRVAVCAGGALPSLWEMQALDAASPDAPVAVAVVSRGDVTFHGFTRVQLPALFGG